MEETKDVRRAFFDESGTTQYYIGIPTADVVRGSDWVYSKTYTKCLMEGITTSAEMLDILRRRNIIGQEFEQRSAELTETLARKVAQLEAADTMEEKRDLAIDVSRGREELFQWNQRLSGPMNNTCEQIADDARLEYLTANIVEKEDGSKVWPDYDTYLREKNQSLALRARFEVMLYLQGVESDFLEKTPEAKAMREIEADLIAKAKEAMRAAEAVQKERAAEAEAAAEPKKTTTKKRTTRTKSTTKKA